MLEDKKGGEGALSSEALARDKWRGGVTVEQSDAPGHTLPESERSSGDDEAAQRSGAVGATILPPD